MNELSPKSVSFLQELANSGFSLREITKLTGIHKNTIQRHTDKIREILKCGCGQPIKHRGWCKYRVQRSEKRKSFLKRWGKMLDKYDCIPAFQIVLIPCRMCQKDFYKLWGENSEICESCKAILAEYFEKRKRTAKDRQWQRTMNNIHKNPIFFRALAGFGEISK